MARWHATVADRESMDRKRLATWGTGLGLVGLLAGAALLLQQEAPTSRLLALLPMVLITLAAGGMMWRQTRQQQRLQTVVRAWAHRQGLHGLPTDLHPSASDPMALMEAALQACEQHFQGLESENLDTLAKHRLLAYRKGRAEAVIQQLPDGVLVLDGEGLPSLVNAKLEPLLGVPPSQMLGQAAHLWCPQPEVLAFIQAQRLTHDRPPPRPARQEISLPGEPARVLELQAQALAAQGDASQLYGSLIVVRDITAQRLASAAGSEFVSNVAHELKTPLNSLKAYSELLMDQGEDPSLRTEAVNVISAEVDRMSNLINNLLSISKLETGAMSLSAARVNVYDLLHASFEAQRQSALGKGLGFRIDVPPNLGMASLDKDLLRIALNNLLSNAIKYNRPGGEVVLSAAEVDEATLEIHVRDTGIGMAAQHLARIFDKHYRIAGDDASRSGHGLGLYLAKQIVEMHQGSLTVMSELGQGTEFILRLRKIPALYLEGAAQ